MLNLYMQTGRSVSISELTNIALYNSVSKQTAVFCRDNGSLEQAAQCVSSNHLLSDGSCVVDMADVSISAGPMSDLYLPTRLTDHLQDITTDHSSNYHHYTINESMEIPAQVHHQTDEYDQIITD